MSENEIAVSVIVPIYNTEKYLRGCLDSLVEQTIDKSKMEVLLIVDGSPDNSLAVCNEYAEKYPYMHVYSKENEGLSKTRNFGIERAKGKYITYLDSDDKLSASVLADTTSFFDEHYDEIDEVTYKIVYVEKGRRKNKIHFRYQILKETGIYDLTKDDGIYISQTNINVVVKNLGENNILFDETKGYKHEDQKYNMTVLMNKKKIGYVSGCEYLYESNPDSIVSGFNAYTLFDLTMQKWEEIFSGFGEDVPLYVQALYFNDLQWKIKADVLLPQYLDGEEYEEQVGRIGKLLCQVDDSVIIDHPDCNESNKYYFISMKYGGKLKAEFNDTVKLIHGENIIYQSDKINLIMTRFKAHGNMLEVCGYLSSPAFLYSEKPEIFVKSKDKALPLELSDSSWCYDNASVKNNQAWGFRYTVDVSSNVEFSFCVKCAGKEYNTEIIYGDWVVFDKGEKNSEYTLGGKHFAIKNGIIKVNNVSKLSEIKYKIGKIFSYLKTNKKVAVVRVLNLLMPKKRVWLYHDCKTSSKDNGYYQFCHDFEIKDGVRRYYVVNGDIDSIKSQFTAEQQKFLIRLRSSKHKMLYLSAEKIVTAFIENVNYLPFFSDAYPHYKDLFSGEVVYLQHGVLHAHLPWKYAYDRLDVSYEVVSTEYEVKNFTENYCFPEEALIKSKMPRYDLIDCDASSSGNRILFAPSWRKYLIKMQGDGEWIAKKDKFVKSDYYIKTQKLFDSEILSKLLEENDWYLDYKPHPIFARYNDCFKINNPRIRIPETVIQSDYNVVITDYSSFVFDFVYLGRAVVYFLPDYLQFKAGFNDYRQLDIPFENGFGEFCQTSEEVIAAIEKIIKNDGKSIPPFDDKNNNFFFNKNKDCREKIYKALNN